MTLPAYEMHRDSGTVWLGQVPDAWRVVPLKHVAEFVNGCVFKPDSWSEAGIPIIRIENLNGSSNFNFYDGEIDGRHHVSNGDLLFGWSGNRGTSFGPFVWKGEGLHYLNQHIFKVQVIECHPRWLYWTLRAVTSHVEDQATGIIGMVHVTKGDLGAIKVPVPRSDEQYAIAGFLDHETAKIDGLIAEQEKLIALLAEKRQATISHAVTRGLNPQAPMKDSGVPWLGEVPAHWAVKQLRYVASVVRGASPRPAGDPRFFAADSESGANTPWVTVAEVTKDESMLLTEVNEFLTPDGVANSQSFRAGTLLFTNSGATLGVPKILGIDCCANDGIVAFNRLDPSVDIRFLYFFLCTTTERLRTEMKQGGGQPNLNTGIVKDISFGLPPLGEQQQIVDSLRTKLEKLDELRTEALIAVALLNERRSALIAAAVTGQIDVRGFTAA